MNTNQNIWARVQKDISYGYNPEMAQYLACNDNDNMLMELLASITFRFQRKWIRLGSLQLKNLYHTIVKKHSRKNNMLNFILQMFKVIDLG